jgi:AcrR family transcriptional regulator
MPTATGLRRPRTQSERRAATRQLLLDTTLECLARYGYARTTTQLICEESGLTRGAPQHYFSTHDGLLVEAIDHLRQQFTSTYDALISGLPEGPQHVQAALDVLWELFTSELFRCALELWVGGRTSPALAEKLAPVERELDRITMRLCRDLFPELAPLPAFDQVIVLILSSIRGLALLEIVQPSGASAGRWPQVRAELLRSIEQHTEGAHQDS